jgi:hypothetical protein
MRIKIVLIALLFCSYSLFGQVSTEKWKTIELTLKGPSNGNPFKDVKFSGLFINNGDSIKVPGFYDGEGAYKIRFMPQEVGKWIYETSSNVKKLDNKKGTFICTPPQKDNHGPVVVQDTFYFAYAD